MNNIKLYTTNDNWPISKNGKLKELSDCMDDIIGKDLNDELGKYYDGWGEDLGTGAMEWFFYNVPRFLTKEVKQKFEELDPSYLMIKIT